MKNRSRFVSLVGGFLLVAGTAAGQTAPPSNPELARRIVEYLRPLQDAGELSGTLLVARDGAVVYEQAFGMASYELAVPNTTSTRYCVASISKPLTMIVAYRLVEQKKLALTDTLDKWFPDFPRAKEITVEHLLRHRAGIPHRVTSDAEEAVPHTAAEMVVLASRNELLFPPGSQGAYSSAGYSVLARVLELASGKPYEERREEIVLAPARAVHTVHPSPRRLVPGRAPSHLRGVRGPVPASLKDLSFLVGAGSLFSTPRDLFSILQALLAGTYGQEARQSLIREKGVSWNGITNGYRAFADHHLDGKLTVIFTGNLFTGAADLLRRDIPKMAAGEAVKAPQVPKVDPKPMSAALQKRYAGLYELRPGSQEPLEFGGPDEAWLGDWRLIPTSDTTFFSPQDYGTVHMVIGKDGAVEALEWKTADGNSLRFSRVTAPGPGETTPK
ncbi:MAG TPA: serine hydrolase domain-containing protein [Thermoanaerobaculia bacterium]|nr:serine hydrolase domain-containing protein [Thermoanaerobaculia bacterium]